MEPEESAVLSGEAAGSHKIAGTRFKKYFNRFFLGVGAGFVPKILDCNLFEKENIIKVHSDEALIMARRLALEEGLLVG